MEKQGLQPVFWSGDLNRKVKHTKFRLLVGAFFAVWLMMWSWNSVWYVDQVLMGPVAAALNDGLCPISGKHFPEDFAILKKTLDTVLFDESFKNSSAAKLGGAVRIATEIKDDWRDIEGEDFASFAELHKYLKHTFPAIYEKLTVETVNKYGLVYTWQGTNDSLKPILLTAHQDVVPVEWATSNRWTYHPYSGHFDGDRVWGRGASDCKSLLIGLLETVELLISDNFSPNRTIIIALGYDEEASGTLGAEKIAEVLYNRYGQNSIYALIDEGNEGIEKVSDRYFAQVVTGEKGYVDSVILLTTPGGHSSVPPDHTSIGIASQLITLIEDTPFESQLTNVNPFLGFLQCYAVHSQEIKPALKKSILKAGLDRDANKNLVKYLDRDRHTRYLIRTSQATDIIFGGIKSNALPESVKILINSRISVESSVAETAKKITKNILEIANTFDLGLIVEGKELKPVTEQGFFNYTLVDQLELAPVTPWSGDVWKVFSGTLRHFYEDVVYNGTIKEPLVVTPGLIGGNTDTKSYWKLTNNIYRYQPGNLNKQSNNIHTVDESVDIHSHLNIVAFYYEYLHNVNLPSDFDHE